MNCDRFITAKVQMYKDVRKGAYPAKPTVASDCDLLAQR